RPAGAALERPGGNRRCAGASVGCAGGDGRAMKADRLMPASPDAPGPRSRAVHRAERELIAPRIQRIAQLSELTVAEGHGATLVDVDGNAYLDFFAGVAVASLGHSHPRFVAALKQQLDRVVVGSFTSENRLRLLERIASVAPGDLDRTQ